MVWMMISMIFAALFIAQPAFAANSNSISLNGSNQYLYAADSASLSITGDMTIEFWAKFDNFYTGTYGQIVSKYGGGTSERAYNVGVYQDPTYNYKWFTTRTSATGGSDVVDLRRAYPLATSTWYHMAFVYDASEGNIDIYLAKDGDVEHTFVGTETKHTTSLKDSVSKFMIGTSDGDDPTVFFDGLIDEVRVWSKVRSSSEIDADFRNELSGTETDLEGYWSFDSTLEDATINNNDLTNVGSASYSTDVPFTIKSADITGASAQYWSITDANQTGLDFTNDMTLSMWVKLDSIPSPSNEVYLVNRCQNIGNCAYDWYLQTTTNLAPGTNVRWSFRTSNNGSTLITKSVDVNFPLNEWVHVAVSKDDGVATYFMNGVAFASSTGLHTSLYNTGIDFKLGTKFTTSYFDGLMDDARVWGRALSSSEITDLHNNPESFNNGSNLVGHWRFDGIGDDHSGTGNHVTNNNGISFSTDVAF